VLVGHFAYLRKERLVNQVSRISNRYFSPLSCIKLVLLVFVFVCTQASTAAPKSVFVAGAPMFSQLRVLQLSRGVVLRTEVLYTAVGPLLVNMLSVDLTNPDVHLEVVQAHNRLISTDETVSSMANRVGALAGVNGDFFEIRARGRPIGMEVINKALMQSPSIYAVFGVTQSRRFTIAHQTLVATVTDGKASYRLSSINHLVELGEGKLGLITPAIGASVPVWGDVVVMLQPIRGKPNQFDVRSVQPSGQILPALSGQYALVGRYAGGAWMMAHLHKGDRLSVNARISPDHHLIQALGGGPILVKDGAFYYDYPSPLPGTLYFRKPLTAVGVTRDGKHALFVVFDGRSSGPLRSVGLTSVQAAYFLMAHGAYQAMLFDGGGSSEMVARLPGHNSVSVVNFPSDGWERPVANGLFVYTSTGQFAVPHLIDLETYSSWFNKLNRLNQY